MFIGRRKSANPNGNLREGASEGQPEGVSRQRNSPARRKVFDTLTMPNGQKLKIMREDAFRAALAASRDVGSR